MAVNIVEALATDLLVEVRRHLNGVVAASLREQGANYPYCLGVPLPTLRDIGRVYAPNQPLARYLLTRSMRESLLLASIVADPNEHQESDTQLWIRTFCYTECIDVACADYLWKLHDANRLAYAWLVDEESTLQRAGVVLLANLYRKTPHLALPPAPYTLEWLYARVAQLAAHRSLYQPLLFLSQCLARSGNCKPLLNALGDPSLPDDSLVARSQLADCIRFELE